MKHKRLFTLVVLLLFVSISIFIIYNNTYEENFNYVALGDSLAAGRNPYGVDEYGYSDYIKDYLNERNILNSYLNYAVSGYLASDVIEDINNNKTININDTNIGLKKSLRDSDLVTISIGANDILEGINLSMLPSLVSDRNMITDKIDKTFDVIGKMLTIIKQYAKNDIIVVGYYNPLPNLTKYKKDIDDVISYVDQKYEDLCSAHDIHYVKISDVIGKDNDYLPNPLDIHPSIKGYEAISKEIIKIIEKNVLK